MNHYVGWEIPENERSRLLAKYPTSFPNIIAHHVTLEFGVSRDHPIPPEVSASIIGVTVDYSRGVQALVVEIDGTTVRPDGSTFHVTWSLDRDAGAKAAYSNTAIDVHGWEPVPRDPIALSPRIF